MYKSYGSKGTIREVLDAIQRRNLVLPAIQREFGWRPEQICQFFDSLMQGYPFGTFLFWRVEPDKSNNFKWYDFVRNYHEKNNPHCPELGEMPNQALTAVLDGQQRLTALNIGLQGSMAWKLPRAHYRFPQNFPTRCLYLNILAEADEEQGARYQFAFLREDRPRDFSENECWFRVADIRGMQRSADVIRWIGDNSPPDDLSDRALETLSLLQEIVHLKPMITYYEELSQDIEQVLQIFIRMNSGGTFLSYSDLLLSIAVAQWNHLDARKEIHDLVDDLNGIGRGFSFSKDFVLKAGLMLCDVNVVFRVDNFNRANMDILEASWPNVKKVLLLTVKLVDRFGLSRDNLSAANALLPIAYHLYRAGHGDGFLTHTSYRQNREAMRLWLIRSLLKQGTWTGGGVDGVLMALRQAISKNGSADFPIDSVMRVMFGRGKSLGFTDEEIEDLADMRSADRRAFLLLSLLFPFLNLEHHFHVDHIFPRARFSEDDLNAAGIPEGEHRSYREMMDGLPNLQLLEGSKNTEKQTMIPSDWLDKHTGGNPVVRQAYIDRHLLGAIPGGLHEFKDFYEARLKCLEERIREVLGVGPGDSSP
ncbi:MAG: DUF262 domain-containing protein [Gemmatimonadetes bacterium]|nr:DUF262 domain-containing protein [Gemmatimonadota bacterium]